MVALEDTSNFNAVTSLAHIDKLIVRTDRDSVGCLAVRNVVGRFLQFNDLFVRKARSVVYNLHGVGRFAGVAWALCGLGDLATINIDADAMIANSTAEEG